MPEASMRLRPYASTYVHRRIRREDCLHIDVWSYPLQWKGSEYYAIRYQMRRGGRGHDPVSELVMLITPNTDADPVQVPTNHAALIDMYLADPVKMNSRERRDLSQWFTSYHHTHLRDIAALYPVDALGCRSRSVRFHYFTEPDHDPRQGFKNWFTAPRRR